MATILVIDDDLLLCRLISRVLSSAGHTVVEAHNGYEGVALAQRHQPTLIITDIVMPDKEGIETILEIRRAIPQAKIIAISGGGSYSSKGVSYLSMALALGADAAIEKPFLPAELTEIVNRLM